SSNRARTSHSSQRGTMRAFVVLAILMTLLAPAGARPKKKHAAQKTVEVTHEGVRYVAAHRLRASGEKATHAAYVEAWDTKSKRKLWEALLYENEASEADNVLLTSMKIDGDKLVVRKGHKEEFEVDLASHQVAQRQ